MIDQEGGEVKRLDGPPNVDPPDLGEAGADTARSEGEETGNFLKTAKVNVDLAPVLDVELPQTADSIAERTFSDDAAVVSEVGTAFIEGLQSTGVAATAKHFPGLGPATLNTDDSRRSRSTPFATRRSRRRCSRSRRRWTPGSSW